MLVSVMHDLCHSDQAHDSNASTHTKKRRGNGEKSRSYRGARYFGAGRGSEPADSQSQTLHDIARARGEVRRGEAR